MYFEMQRELSVVLFLQSLKFRLALASANWSRGAVFLHETTTWIYHFMGLEISKLYTGNPTICPYSVI